MYVYDKDLMNAYLYCGHTVFFLILFENVLISICYTCSDIFVFTYVIMSCRMLLIIYVHRSIYFINYFKFIPLSTGSHTAFMISSKIDFIAQKFLGIDDLEDSNWRPPMTTDCGSNVALAIDTNKFAFWMKCCLHMINLSV